jgi:hypothetical protein
MITLIENKYDSNGYWANPIPNESQTWQIAPDSKYVDIFDQNGYDLTELECLFAKANNQPAIEHRYKQTLKQEWFTQQPKVEGAVLNHAYLFERKGYSGEAKKQLQQWATTNPLIYKLLSYQPKWGIDFSMDWVDRAGNVFEILHFEYDGFGCEEIEAVKQKLEPIFLNTNWEEAGKQLLQRKSEWHHLGFFDQSDWKCNFFNIMPERFKMVGWE